MKNLILSLSLMLCALQALWTFSTAQSSEPHFEREIVVYRDGDSEGFEMHLVSYYSEGQKVYVISSGPVFGLGYLDGWSIYNNRDYNPDYNPHTDIWYEQYTHCSQPSGLTVYFNLEPHEFGDYTKRDGTGIAFAARMKGQTFNYVLDSEPYADRMDLVRSWDDEVNDYAYYIADDPVGNLGYMMAFGFMENPDYDPYSDEWYKRYRFMAEIDAVIFYFNIRMDDIPERSRFIYNGEEYFELY